MKLAKFCRFKQGIDESWRNLVAHLTMTHAMGGADALTFNPPSWTIGAEFYTYFLFVGFLVLTAGRRFGLGVAAILILIIAGIYAWLAAIKPNMDITYDYGFYRCIAGFFIGVLAARLFRNGPSATIQKYATPLEIGLLTASVLFIIYCEGKLQFLAGPFLFGFVYLFAHDGGLVSRFMRGWVFTYLAKISYSVYMIHVIIAIAFAIGAEQVLGRAMPDWNATGWGGDLLLLPYLAVVIGASHLTYHLIELPGGKAVRKLFSGVTKHSPKTPPTLKGDA
ncbi:acyltransferase family protein [Litorimonas sp. RW-G-Af-16]|uniref:acyltransferase family protein n=1 Tax=Litorimonas sp. RW-G-Af-16 TaxID=3241168 RepID=UPI003AAA2F46